MKIGGNSPCPCGSGDKYKRCCMEKHSDKVVQRLINRSETTERWHADVILQFSDHSTEHMHFILDNLKGADEQRIRKEVDTLAAARIVEELGVETGYVQNELFLSPRANRLEGCTGYTIGAVWKETASTETISLLLGNGG